MKLISKTRARIIGVQAQNNGFPYRIWVRDLADLTAKTIQSMHSESKFKLFYALVLSQKEKLNWDISDLKVRERPVYQSEFMEVEVPIIHRRQSTILGQLTSKLLKTCQWR